MKHIWRANRYNIRLFSFKHFFGIGIPSINAVIFGSFFCVISEVITNRNYLIIFFISFVCRNMRAVCNHSATNNTNINLLHNSPFYHKLIFQIPQELHQHKEYPLVLRLLVPIHELQDLESYN